MKKSYKPTKKVRQEPPPKPAVIETEKTLTIPAKEVVRALIAPRPPCIECVRKHIAQAIILLGESEMGYPEHLWLAVGHLAEASEECLGLYPLVAAEIREHRLKAMEGEIPDLMKYLRDDFELINQDIVSKDT